LKKEEESLGIFLLTDIWFPYSYPVWMEKEVVGYIECKLLEKEVGADAVGGCRWW